MSFQLLLKHLSNQSQPPVVVDDIRDWIIENRLQERISFISTPHYYKLGAKLKQTHVPNTVYDADPDRLSVIFYTENADEKTQRVACCKELLHILTDTDLSRTYTKEHVSALTQQLTSHSSPGELVEQIISEHVNRALALITLVPLQFINRYEKKYLDKQMSSSEISDKLEIPDQFIPELFTGTFRQMAMAVLN